MLASIGEEPPDGLVNDGAVLAATEVGTAMPGGGPSGRHRPLFPVNVTTLAGLQVGVAGDVSSPVTCSIPRR